jgi:hypothetical protein
MTTEEEVLSPEDEIEKFKFVQHGPAYRGKSDHSGVHFILALLALALLLVIVLGILQVAISLKQDKTAEMFSLTRDLATYPNGNDWIVAGVALAIYVRCILWLISRVYIGGIKVLAEIQAENYLMVFVSGACQLLNLFALFLLIVAGFLFQ